LLLLAASHLGIASKPSLQSQLLPHASPQPRPSPHQPTSRLQPTFLLLKRLLNTPPRPRKSTRPQPLKRTQHRRRSFTPLVSTTELGTWDLNVLKLESFVSSDQAPSAPPPQMQPTYVAPSQQYYSQPPPQQYQSSGSNLGSAIVTGAVIGAAVRRPATALMVAAVARPGRRRW
jgi:hypothetical protein